MRVLFVIAVIFLTTGQASAQDERPFLREGPIGRAESDLVCDAGERDPYPVACWEGEELVFLPAERGTVSSYAEAEFVLRAGSVADVVSVDETRDGVYEIVLKDRADGAELKRRISKDRYFLDGVALVRDIEAARSHYVGDSLFTTDRIAKLNTYDPDVHRLRSFDVDPGDRVLVEDIVIGWDVENPLRVIVRTAEGKEGFVDVAWRSTINYSGEVVDRHLLERYLSDSAPELVSEEETQESEAAEIFIIVEEMPELVGGLSTIQSQIRYPEEARKAGIEGRVFVQFIVDEDGNVIDPVVTRGPDHGLHEEAIRVVSQAEWTPGKQRGQPVRVRMSLPIGFRLR